MQRALIWKIIAIILLIIPILISLFFIDDTIYERKRYQADVIRDISSSWTGSQTITPAIFVIPYTETIVEKTEKSIDGISRTTTTPVKYNRVHYYLPENLNIEGDIKTSERYRGIYKVPVYTADLKMSGHFQIPKENGFDLEKRDIIWGEPVLIFGIKDIRGINRSIEMSVNNKNIELFPGTKSSAIEQGIHGVVPLDFNKEQKIEFETRLNLNGMQNISFIPTGKFTNIQLSSPWQHPSFEGRFLPAERTISENGFEAKWETSFFSSNMERLAEDCFLKGQCSLFQHSHFGVSFIEGIDVYQKSERALKYGMIFVILTFVTFFLFQILKNLRIHPIQYGLVGFAMMLFYLLLISLSEHLTFIYAYIIATSACVGLLTFYVSYVLKSIQRAMVFGLILLGLYGALYMILRSEDYALLMGSFLLFGAMAFIMIITRHVNWYQIGTSK